MEFKDSALQFEVEKIISDGEKPVSYFYSCEIKAGQYTIKPLKFVSMDDMGNYITNFSNEMFLSVLIPAGQYVRKIFQNRNNIEITLIKTPLTEVSASANSSNMIEYRKFIGVLEDNHGNPIIESNSTADMTEEALDLTDIITVTFQLIEKAIEQLRVIQTGGSYQNETVENVIRTIMTTESKQLKLPDEFIPKGVEMVKPSNQAKMNHIIIEHGTKLVDIPQHVHDHCGGVYSAGIGYFYSTNRWYIFPAYDTTRFDNSVKTLTVINIPANKMPGIERTYRLDYNNTVVLATGSVKFKDRSYQEEINSGNGIRFQDANQLLDGFVKVVGNKAIASRAKNLVEIVSKTKKISSTIGFNSFIPSNTNKFVQTSQLAIKMGAVLTLNWENAKIDLIYPGMPVKLMYLDGDNIKTVFGVLIGHHRYVHTPDQVVFANKHITNIALMIFVNTDGTLNK